jgi:hypothetical protein
LRVESRGERADLQVVEAPAEGGPNHGLPETLDDEPVGYVAFDEMFVVLGRFDSANVEKKRAKGMTKPQLKQRRQIPLEMFS